ncbi:metal dependent phosphohydrolase [Caldithrix abyssi DSM 13497]|uniref:HDIG domain-containing protein n=1 Tax=Caldithrix abyssi DSM 13497 TaxID=880073 RepID=H1XSU8_CALAY|nr:HD domain-containing phosphohydrolase [Caldithrix abyssi]APF20274.1 HDIG domain-containing protein [Caldithrix abyssi DSM 13497]EHO40325.1 metal dependent phosphohydrolase [Caldithrix abyssi DSM 13497]
MIKADLNLIQAKASSLFMGAMSAVLLLSVLIISFPPSSPSALIYYLALSGLILQALGLIIWALFYHDKTFAASQAAVILAIDLVILFVAFYPLSAGSMLFMAGPALILTTNALLFNETHFKNINYLAAFLLLVSSLVWGLTGYLPHVLFQMISQAVVYGIAAGGIFWVKKLAFEFKARSEQLENQIERLEEEKEHFKKGFYILKQGSEELNKDIKRREIEIQNIVTISEQIQIGKDSRDVLGSFLLTALGQMGSSHAFIMAREKKNQNYWNILVEKGLRTLNKSQLKIYLDSNIISILRAFREPLYLRELPRDNLFADELNFMKQFEKDVICPIYVKNKILGMVAFGPKVTGAEYTKEDFNLISVVANQSAFILEQVQQSDEFRDQFARTVRAMLYAMEAKFFFNRGHLVRTANYVSMTAKRLGFPPNEIRQLGLGALLHDIGKTAIDDRYLLYDKSLSNSLKDAKIKERILTHTIEGGKILKSAGFNDLMVDMAVHHHEYFNGRGYPHRIGGEEIPMETRMLSVCNAYDAMTSERPYRKALSEIQAMEVLKQQSGQQFDPEVVKAFLDIVKHVTPKPTKH